MDYRSGRWALKLRIQVGPQKIAHPGFEGTASFSPDGMQVAFSWCRYEGTPLWNPAYRNICNIYIKQIGVEPPYRLTETAAKEFSPAWSPDGKWIAFLRLVSSTRFSLIRIPQRGGRERVVLEYDLSENPNMPQGPHLAWTPDSKWLVCATPGTPAWVLSLVSPETGEKRVLTKPLQTDLGDTAPAISPDGRTLVFSRYEGKYNLHKLSLGEQYAPLGEPKRLRSTDAQNVGLAWLPDGSEIVFASGFAGEGGLWRTSASGGAEPQRLPFAPEFAAEPAISRRNDRLAYTAYRTDSNIWRVELVGPGRKPAAPEPVVISTKPDGQPTFSPDGSKVAFVSGRSGTPEVWLCDRDGSNPHQLTSFGGMGFDGPQWSPDGQHIALRVYAEDEQKLAIISAKNGALRVLSLPGGGKWPSWSPDGQWLYFASTRRPVAIWKIPTGGGAPVQITPGPDDDMPQPSADGTFLYYSKGWPGPFSIWRIPVDGGKMTKIIDGVSPNGQWTVGIDGIYFFATPDAKGRSEIQLYEFATGRTKKILTVERTIGTRIVVSPDGRTILYPQIDEQGSDLMLVENFH